MKKNKYLIICFVSKNAIGISFDKSDLLSAFYCFRECINSGLYKFVVFRVVTYYDAGLASSPIMEYIRNENKIVKMDNSKFNYFARYKSYLKKYGTTKNVNFEEA